MNPSFQINGIGYLKWLTLNHEEEELAQIAAFIEAWSKNTKSYKFQTSGSTGIPKTIEIDRAYMEHSAQVTGEFFGLTEGCSSLLCLPVKFIAGRMMLVRAMVLGLDLHVAKPEVKEIVKLKPKFHFCAMTPHQVSRILDTDVTFFDSIEMLIIGGGDINTLLERKLENLKTKCYATFGMTETVSHIALREIGVKTCFKALPGVKFHQNEEGQLIIHASGWGVHNMITNDMVNLLSEKEFEWLGRIDNVINSGGIKVFPERIESILEGQIPGNFFIAGLPDQHLGNKVVLLVEGEETPVDFSQLSSYEKPKEVFSISRFKYTDTGKIQRSETLNLIEYS
ncbi:MAG: O-succinylbenzoic acid--CoA ligase [Crocinitomicaceae bacterium]|nr:O-succinylbenzoic acid--CoA ligase [Crocinitomicaceae bacterium]|tara:strand:- start:7019 stop:8035 length:1017 start_codon:yes stop_codon:yes gene_type:complete